MHPDDDLLHAFADGELAVQRATETAAHLEACVECRGRMAAIRADTTAVFTGLATLDVDAPAISFGQIVARGGVRAGKRPIRRWAAAAVLAVTVSGLAVAAPRSPVGAWLRSLMSGRVARDTVSPPTAPAATRPRDDAFDRTGVTIYPGDSLRIDFARWQDAGDMTVALVDSAPVTVRTAAGAATFSVSSTSLGVANTRPDAHFDVWIPRRASYIEIRVAGHRVYLHARASGSIGNAADSNPKQRISLVRDTTLSQTRR